VATNLPLLSVHVPTPTIPSAVMIGLSLIRLPFFVFVEHFQVERRFSPKLIAFSF